MGIGVCCFVLGGIFIFGMPRQPVAAMLPILLAYAFIVVGAYRLVLGKTPVPAHPGELSVKRVVFAVVTIIIVFGALIGLVYLGESLYGFLQRRT